MLGFVERLNLGCVRFGALPITGTKYEVSHRSPENHHRWRDQTDHYRSETMHERVRSRDSTNHHALTVTRPTCSRRLYFEHFYIRLSTILERFHSYPIFPDFLPHLRDTYQLRSFVSNRSPLYWFWLGPSQYPRAR